MYVKREIFFLPTKLQRAQTCAQKRGNIEQKVAFGYFVSATLQNRD